MSSSDDRLTGPVTGFRGGGACASAGFLHVGQQRGLGLIRRAIWEKLSTTAFHQVLEACTAGEQRRKLTLLNVFSLGHAVVSARIASPLEVVSGDIFSRA